MESLDSKANHKVFVTDLGSKAAVTSNRKEERDLKAFNEFVTHIFEKIEPYVLIQNRGWKFMTLTLVNEIAALNSKLESMIGSNEVDKIHEEILDQSLQINECLLVYFSNLLKESTQNLRNLTDEEMIYAKEATISFSLMCRLIYGNLSSKTSCTDERMERMTSLVCEILNRYLSIKADQQTLRSRSRLDFPASTLDISPVQGSNKNVKERGKGGKGNGNQKLCQKLISCHDVPDLVANSAKMVHDLSTLILAFKISEPFVLRLIRTSFSVLASSDAELLRANVVEMIAHVFNRYPNLRTNIIDKIIEIIENEICGGGSYARLFYIPEDSAKRIGMIPAVLLSCLQSCAEYHEYTCDISGEDEEKKIAHAFHWSNIFWSGLLVKVSRLQERDSRKLIPKLVEDLLLCLNLPEWPVSSLTLLNLCALLLGKFGLQHKDPKFRERALDIVSQVCARLRSESLSCEAYEKIISCGDDSNISDGLIQASNDIRSFSISGDKLSKIQSICIEGILIRYLLNNIKQRTSMDISKGKEYFICDSVMHRLHNALIFQVCQMTNEIKRHPKHYFCEVKNDFYWNLYEKIKMDISSKRGAAGQDKTLSRNSIMVVNSLLQIHGPLARQNDILFHRIIGMLDDVSIIVRTTGIRSLSRIVSMDPSMLINPRIHQILSKRMTDPATLVRCAVIELIGQFICSNKEVRLKYWSKILDRISDIGVSVRKRVIMIMQEIALDANNESAIYFNYRIALRVMDTDSSVQLLVIQYFRKKWFHTTAVTDSRRKDAWLIFVKLMWYMHSNFFRRLDSKLPSLFDYPLLLLLHRILRPTDEEVQSDAMDLEVLKKSGCGLITYIFEGLVNSTDLERQFESQHASKTYIQTGDMMESEKKTLTPEMFAFSLNAFALIEPSFLVPVNDPLYFLIGLEPYLHRRDGTIESKSNFTQSVLSIINEIVCYNCRISTSLCQTVVDDVCLLILYSKNSGIVDYATKCLTSFASISADSRGKLKRLTLKLLLLLGRENTSDKDRKVLKSRAIFVLGKILRYNSEEFLDSQHSSHLCEISENEPVLAVTLLQIFRRYIFIEDESTNINRNALEACGSLLLSAQASASIYNTPESLLVLDEIMHKTLSASNIELKIQAIKNLEGILCTEDSNISSISRRRNQSTLNTYIGLKVNYGSSSARIQIENGELDHSNAVYIQRYWKEILLLCKDDDSQVRVKTLCLVEIILRKGLVHPLSAYRALLELNLDQSKKIRKLALRILKAQYEKYTDLYYQQLSEAIEQLFKIITAKPCESRSTNDGKSTMKSHFFEEFHSEGFKNILGVLTGNRGGAMKVLEVIIKLIKKQVSEAANLHFIKFLSYLISYMTFTSNAEPTYATHQLHRVIVLHATELTRKVEEHSEPRLPLSDRFLITKSAMQVQKEAKNLSLCLNVIYQLKQYLQEKFKIRDEQLLPHMQSEKLNFGQLRVNENIEPLNITVTDVPLKYTEIAYHEHVSNLIDLVEPSFPQQK